MQRSQRTRAVVFDFNGTVSDDEALLEQIFRRMLAEMGCELTESEYYGDLAGLSDQAIIEGALERAGLRASPEQVTRLVVRKLELYKAAVAGHSPITAAAARFVEATAARVPIAIASGAPREEVMTVLDGAGLLGLFGVIVCLEDVERGKPDPQAYETALSRLNDGYANGAPIAPGEVLVFEDSDPGVRAAKAALMRCVALRTPAYSGLPVGADTTIAGLDPALVDRLLFGWP